MYWIASQFHNVFVKIKLGISRGDVASLGLKNNAIFTFNKTINIFHIA